MVGGGDNDHVAFMEDGLTTWRETIASLRDGCRNKDIILDWQIHQFLANDFGIARHAELERLNLIIYETIERFNIFAAGVDDGANKAQNGVGDDVAWCDDSLELVFAKNFEHLCTVDFGDVIVHAAFVGIHADQNVFFIDAGEGDETVKVGDAFFFEIAVIAAIGKHHVHVWMQLFSRTLMWYLVEPFSISLSK